MEPAYEKPTNPDRNMKEVRFYIMFESTEARDQAKAVLKQILEDDKKRAFIGCRLVQIIGCHSNPTL